MEGRRYEYHERATDSQGRIINPGSWTDEEIDEKVKDILKNAKVSPYSVPKDGELPKPYFLQNLIEQYDFFRRNINEPKRIFYPCCELDISPLKGFPNSEIVLMDKEPTLETIMKQEGITQYIQGDVLTYIPENPFDLVIALNPALSSEDLTKYLVNGGHVLANNWHNNASQLLEDSSFEGLGTIDKNAHGIYLAKGDFSKLEPHQFPNYLYVFRKL
ncbi:MAG: hypothetical protein Q7S74_04725 [Nanoarchaeota archaeon]|nr:hypothetical protein [Nanoarchaeota archaeon]